MTPTSIHSVGPITNASQLKHAVHHSALTILRHAAIDRDGAVDPDRRQRFDNQRRQHEHQREQWDHRTHPACPTDGGALAAQVTNVTPDAPDDGRAVVRIRLPGERGKCQRSCLAGDLGGLGVGQLHHRSGQRLVAGAVYVTDFNNGVVRLDPGSDNPTALPFTGATAPWGIAVDNAGSVYVTEHDKNQVVKYAARSSTPTVLPLTGLNTPLAVAVDKNGNVYVADRGNDRVVKLAG